MVNQNDYSDLWVHIDFVSEREPAKESCEKVLKLLDQDFADLNLPQVSCLSVNDKCALKIMEESVVKVGKQYQITLPWKSNFFQLPNNKKLAERRLQSLQKKLSADPDLYTKYCKKMNEMIEKGYCCPSSSFGFSLLGVATAQQ